MNLDDVKETSLIVWPRRFNYSTVPRRQVRLRDGDGDVASTVTGRHVDGDDDGDGDVVSTVTVTVTVTSA